MFFLWTYTRRIYSNQEGDVEGQTDKEWDRLANVWALGAYLQATDFKDAITDAIIEKALTDSVYQTMHAIINAKSVEGAPIRRLIVDIAATRWDTETLKAQQNDPVWSDFFRDLSIALMAGRPSSVLERARWEYDHCAYHEHRDLNTPCYRTKPGLPGGGAGVSTP
ncbi:hypothetical protein LTR37_019256 [Vermiconidia calcicola]|uniref:Uncharacterized protein n=1 Tax=Vermiconidia calcicola TaxID=1690605 RepID=A0ACC3MFW3_9PEZI|nr:hypothetical protein LTR37_019256 [Vermiconidia calcicola]